MDKRDNEELKEELEARKKQELLANYQMWIGNPMTQLFVSNLDKHEKSFIDLMEAGSMQANITDAQIRLWALGAKTTATIKQVVTNFEAFYKLSHQ
jgi:hypothetical protein